MAIYPWVKAVNVNLDKFDHLTRWMSVMGQRPAVQRDMALKFVP